MKRFQFVHNIGMYETSDPEKGTYYLAAEADAELARLKTCIKANFEFDEEDIAACQRIADSGAKSPFAVGAIRETDDGRPTIILPAIEVTLTPGTYARFLASSPETQGWIVNHLYMALLVGLGEVAMKAAQEKENPNADPS